MHRLLCCICHHLGGSIMLVCPVRSATANPDGRTRALLVGGGIANFTDVALTFKGIIQARSTAMTAT